MNSEPIDEYTPTTEEVRNSWIDYMTTEGDGWDGLSEEESQARWDRWLAAHDREVAATPRVPAEPSADRLREIARHATGTGYYSGGVKALRAVWRAALEAAHSQKGADHDPS